MTDLNSQPTFPNRHCMVVYAFYPLAETRVQRQAEALRERGYEVEVICLHKPGEPFFEVVRGVPVTRLSGRKLHLLPGFGGRMLAYLYFLLLVLFTLTGRHLKQRYDTVQVHNLPDFLVFCAVGAKLMGAKIILDIHDVMPEFFAERSGRPLNSGLVRLITWQEQLSCRFADHVITVTERWRQALIERGVPAAKTSVVMNLADHHLFQRPATPLSRGNGHLRLIYHGTQAPRHGLDTLLQAMAHLRQDAPDIRLTLHGRGDAHEALLAQARRLGLGDTVAFSTAFMPVAELPGFIAAHDVGVIPYQDDLFTGGILPTKLLEYLAVGLPCVAARTAAIADYFDGETVQFFKPGDPADLAQAILTLYREPARRTALVSRSARFLERYNWPAESSRYVALIERLNRP